MPRFSQPQLQRRVEILVDNGRLSQAQTALAGVGYNPTALAQGEALLQAWLTREQGAQTLRTAQKRATELEIQAGQTAQAEASDFSQTVRTLFGDDPLTLTALGLRLRQRNSNGHSATDENGTEHGQSQRQTPSRGLADKIAQWRRLFANAQALSDDQKAQLAQAGWSADRLTEAAALVERYAEANTQQKEQIQRYRSEFAAAKAAEKELRRWYEQASRLSRLAIRKTNPAQERPLRQLLGV